MMKFLLALCGLPASGKTTLARTVKEMLAGRCKVEIVSTDEWRDREYYSNFLPENEHTVRQTALDRTTRILSRGISVIHDDTNYYSSMRHELYVIAKEKRCAFAVVHVSTPLEVALSWNGSRTDALPEAVITRIAYSFEPPGTRYAWDKPVAVVDLSQVRVEKAASEIAHSLQMLRAIGAKTLKGSESKDDELDLATRQAVASFLKEFESLRNNPRVHMIRKKVLGESRKGAVSPEEARTRTMAELRRLAPVKPS
jgi:O-phosphoseryl-tRNA(Sec) kinase